MSEEEKGHEEDQQQLLIMIVGIVTLLILMCFIGCYRRSRHLTIRISTTQVTPFRLRLMILQRKLFFIPTSFSREESRELKTDI